MIAVLLTIHTLIILALIVVVLLQRSEGGAVLSGGGFMTGRGTANALTRTTSGLAAAFFATSMTLAIIAARGEKERSLVEEMTGTTANGAAPTSTDDLLKSLGAEPDTTPLDLDPAPPATPAPQSAPTTAEPAPANEPAEPAPEPATGTPEPNN